MHSNEPEHFQHGCDRRIRRTTANFLRSSSEDEQTCLPSGSGMFLKWVQIRLSIPEISIKPGSEAFLCINMAVMFIVYVHNWKSCLSVWRPFHVLCPPAQQDKDKEQFSVLCSAINTLPHTGGCTMLLLLFGISSVFLHLRTKHLPSGLTLACGS